MSWMGRRVLVTGADGFIGSHLTEALVGGGAVVRAFCFYTSDGSVGWLDELDPDIKDTLDIRRGDIRDARFVAEACEGVEVVFHLAALVAIPYSYQAAESFIDTNVKGTLNILEAVRRAGCERLVHTSTSEVYGTPDTLPITEKHALKGQSPYSASKIGADKLCEAFHCSFGTPVVILRPFNTYGPRQSARAVIPSILAQLLSGAHQVLVGNLEPRRDLTFVSDTVTGFLAAGLREGLEGRTVQLGTGRAESIAEVLRVACEVCGVNAEPVQEPERFRPDGSEVMILQSDPSLAARLLAWKASVRLEDGIARTAAWMEEHLHRFRPCSYAI
jgi:NAD dependent epimerase/dehydratase